MAKVLKTAAIIVGVAVAGFATAGAAWAVAGGASLSAAVASIGATSIFGTITASQVISGAFLVSGIASAFDKPATPTVGATDSGASIDFKADPHAALPYAMGRTGTGGNLIFDDTAGAKSAYLDQVIVWSAAGPVQEIEAIFANDVALGFPNDGGEGQDGFYSHKMWRKNQLGEPGSPLLVSSTVQGAGGIPSEWTDAHRLSGYAATWTSQLYDTTVYSGGAVTWRANVQGVLSYDPRYDTTYTGGSGPMRADDESTWAYSTNPFIHAITWLIGRTQNGKSIGLGVYAPVSSIDLAAYVQGANVADANGWAVSGVVYSSDDKWEVLKAILQAGGAVPLKLGAKISCFVSMPRVSLATMTAVDAVDDVSITAQQSKKTRINTVWPTWPQEAQGWQSQAGDAPISVTDYYSVDGGERSKGITYQLVSDSNQVAQLARYDIEDAREFGPCTFPCKPRWLGYRPGDCFLANEPEWGLNNQLMLILDRQFDPATLVVTLTCRSETTAKHAFALGQTLTAPATPGLTGLDRLLTAPGAGSWEADADLLAGPDGSLPAIVITGAADNPHILAVIVDYRQVFTDAQGVVTYGPWSSISYPASTTSITLSGLVPGGEYQVRIRYQTVGGASDPTVYLDLGAHTVGSVSAAEVMLIDGKTPAELAASIADAAQQGLDALQAAMDLANTASQAILDARSFRDAITKAGFTLDGVPLGPVSQELSSQGDSLAYDRTLLGLRSVDQSAFILNDNTVQYLNGDTLATRQNLLYAADTSNAAGIAGEATARTAAVSNEASARASAIDAEADLRTALAATVSGNNYILSAAVTNETNARVTADSAEATSRLDLAAVVGSNFSTYSNFATTQAGQNSATGSLITSLTSTVGSNYAVFTSFQTTQVSANAATASSLNALGISYAGNSSSISYLLSVSSSLGSQAVLALDYNGNVAGYRFANGSSGSSLVFLGGTIGFTDGTGTYYPLTVSGGNVRIGNLIVAQVEAGSIVADSIVGGAVTAAGSWSDGGGVGLSAGGETSAGGFYFTSTGGRHVINVYGELATTSSSAAGVICRLKRDGSEIKRGNKWCPGSWGGEGLAFACFDQPGAGTFYYELTYQATGGSGACKDGQSAIILTEMKK